MMRNDMSLGEQIADWIVAEITGGAKPIDLGVRLCREIGFGLEVFVRLSAEPGQEDEARSGLIELIAIQAAKLNIVAVREN